MVLLVIVGAVVVSYMVLGRQGWQHHKQPSQDTGHQTTVAAQKELCAQNEKLCVHYPSSWQAKAGQATGGDGKQYDTMVLESPSKQVKLSFNGGITGLGGGPCEPNTYQGVTVLKAEPTKITTKPSDQRSADKLYAVAMIDSNDADGHKAERTNLRLMLTGSRDAIKTGKHEDGCALRYARFFESRNDQAVLAFTNGTIMIGRGEQASSTTQEYPNFASEEAAKKALSSSDYQQAMAILASAHYK